MSAACSTLKALLVSKPNVLYCDYITDSRIGKSKDDIDADPMSAVVIGIRGAKVKFSAMEKVETQETDWKNRRPKDEFWMGYKDLIDTLSGRPKPV